MCCITYDDFGALSIYNIEHLASLHVLFFYFDVFYILISSTIYLNTAHSAYTNTRNERWSKLCIPAVKHVNFSRSTSAMRRS